MFKSATVKLTAVYVGILMAICLIFSLLLYQVLSHELERNNTMQTNFFQDRPRFHPLVDDPEALRFLDRQLSEGKQRILLELFYIDISLLLTGGIASYFLARRTLQPIEEAHEAQTRFTADASHELRTPLATMQTEIEVALRDPKLTLKESKQLLSSNLEEISTLRQLTSGLLTLARENNDGINTSETARLNDVLTGAIARVASAAAKKKITINSTPPSKKLLVSGDITHLTEVFVILLDNAVKYSDEKQTVRLTTQEQDSHVIITITDTGIGISESSLPYVFERFYRADNARTQSGQNGHGLGLSIAKQLVEQNGGTIEMSSKEQEGTTATVRLLTR